MSSDLKPQKIVGALGLPINEKGQMLLTQRQAPKRKFWDGKWQLAGGEIEFGETPEQALAREMQEELSVSARILFPYPIVKSVVYEKGRHIDLNTDVHLTLLCFLVDIGNQTISLDNDPEKETGGFRWFYPEEIYKLECLPLTTDFVSEAQKLIKQNKLVK
ncbi:MAG: hypothetical protein A2900_02540 [Candidatus Chisholmbacteria bacterium RIFCSPLOWO2_01_FULL_50_28]|uniref:Nudix hydrolase domain-containing protein n=1 Tax=Candidatus Chisholmbacteria bacterium RIFCSPHIGHO2_01_FULL_52_32 TaxID=1797591 RepID=A0A1G1VTM3_9BACT|nr:MAG: hypothetical protein A2786_04205 [Candidatus Chisholmbacteria bacterium RIFCSPHIGHO2_01_FULL_52_32]OGY19956.1 MAG: hypothetical protein A2900_02540 [Candidatus Chisholmbacteria bacterium RIFCSPLOWO2_01_FULL_50_28]